ALTLTASVLLQASVNYLNEYFDWKYGLDTPESLGASTVIFRGEMTGRQVLGLGLGCIAVASALGLWLTALVGPAILLFGVAAVFIGYFYSAKPFSFAARGLGDVMVYLAMGLLMVWGSYYTQIPRWSWAALAASVPVGALVVAILNMNNVRDYADDLAVGKRTLPVRFGRAFGVRYHATLLLLAYVTTTCFVILGVGASHSPLALPWPALLAWLTFPAALRNIRSVAAASERDPALRLAVQRTAGLHFQFCALLALGIALAAIFHLAR
ncbi:MAG: 1,4-dihydroxy-2-naphthoate octaprenyltransferase, partial [Chloroflexota bacterium]|nr:1,4-dihydroxy-2-naphthoate octaprenyltransferase [Chloroflexota bacterium]